MNIFVLDKNPIKAAKQLCDQHVVKMPLESAQMLCAAFPKNKAPYKRTHYNHPCTIWTRTSKANYNWLIKHGLALCDEYKYRYKREHKSRDVIIWCKKNISKIKFQTNRLTPFVIAVDNKYKTDDVINSYKLFYVKSKSRFARWRHGRKPPKWYLQGIKD